MNFKRYLCQEFIEAEVGCSDPTQLGKVRISGEILLG